MAYKVHLFLAYLIAKVYGYKVRLFLTYLIARVCGVFVIEANSIFFKGTLSSIASAIFQERSLREQICS